MFDDQFFLGNGYKVLESDNTKFTDFRVLIILGHKKFPTFGSWNKDVFLVSRFLKV
jgi:hypothetical protein